jgi:hypothetical protein
MNKFQNWLLSKMPLLIPTCLPGIEYGSKRLSVQFNTQDSKINPLDITVKSSKNNHTFTEDTLLYKLPGVSPELQFTKRIKNTPIYISCLNNDKYSFYIVDFYEWIPFTILYRVFYFRSFTEEVQIEFQFPDSLKKKDHQTCQFNDWYFSYPENENLRLNGNKLAGSFLENSISQKAMVFFYSEKPMPITDLSAEMLTEKLNRLETRVTKNHILQCLKIQDNIKRHLIDELWFRQKDINPDRKFNDIDTLPQTWIGELIRYLGWEINSETEKDIKTDDDIVEPDSIKKVLYDAYFNNKYDMQKINELIQEWWNQYSLPIFQLKLSKIIQTDPNLVFIIYAFALRMQLPWADFLYRMANHFLHVPQLALFGCLFQIAILKTEKDHSIRYIPGSGINGNVGILKRKEIEYKQTHFGRVQFTSLSKKNVQLFKINKKVVLLHNDSLDQFTVLPYLIGINDIGEYHNSILLEIDSRRYQIPLVWKKAEIMIPGCRIRWIFKRDRFQLTCSIENSVSILKIDDHIIDFTHTNHIKFYYPVKKYENQSVFQLYDEWGRTVFLQHDGLKNEAILLGWLKDRNGLLSEKFNIYKKSRQILKSANESGFVNTSFSLPADVDKIEVKSKHFSENVSVNKISDSAKISLLNYHPMQSRGVILVVYDAKLGPIQKELETYFHTNLGFTPLIFSDEEMTKSHNIRLLFLIGEEKKLSQLKQKKGFSNSLIFPLRFPIDTKEFLRILSINC